MTITKKIRLAPTGCIINITEKESDGEKAKVNENQIKQAESCGYGKIRKVLHKAIILHSGWEMDNEGWIVELEDGTIKGLTTSHGCSICEWSIDDINSHILMTEESLTSLRKASTILGSK